MSDIHFDQKFEDIITIKHICTIEPCKKLTQEICLSGYSVKNQIIWPEAPVWLYHVSTSNRTTQVSLRISCLQLYNNLRQHGRGQNLSLGRKW